MNDNSTYYNDLITRYFSGEITEDEMRLLSGWLKTDQQNEELFRQYQKTWQLIEAHKLQLAIRMDKEWDSIQQKMITPVSGKENPVKVISLNQNRNILKFSTQNFRKIAAAITILVVSSFLLYFYLSKPSEIIVTAQASTIELVLPDGSAISLHAGSQIAYPEKFVSNTRTVELKGQAYFKVAHDKTKPFIVSSGEARVEVLGTQFNVNTKATAGNMEVVLTSGKVSVYFRTNPYENVLLSPGEKAELIANQKHISKTENTDPNYMAWKTRVLVFENETLTNVINALQNVYQSPIELTGKQLADYRVTATFNDQSLQSVLEVLKETLDLQIKQNGNTMELSGKGCK